MLISAGHPRHYRAGARRLAEWFSTGTKFAVALLFYLYGARLSTTEAIRGLTHWRLHLMIFELHVRAVPAGRFGAFTAAFCAR